MLLEELEPPSRAQCGKPRTQPRCWPVKAWRCQSGPDSLSPISARRNQSIQRWDSGLTERISCSRLPFCNWRAHATSTDHQALRASQRGPCDSHHFNCLPTCQETTFSAEEFRTLLLVRLHLPFHMDAQFCKCELLDVYGHHRSACSRIGLLEPRSTPAEGCMARTCPEAGPRVKENKFLRDLNIVAPADDQRRIDIVNGFPFWGGKQVAIDTTVVSALTGRGVARGRRQGQAIHQAEQDKHRRFPELLTGTRYHFIMMALEVAGRWSPSAVTFLRNLAWYKSLSVPRFFTVQPNSCSSSVGQLCWLALSSERALPACWGSLWEHAPV